MLQPRRHFSFVWLAVLLLVDSLKGQDYNIEYTPRKQRQNEKDVTTVLLVDNQGRSSFGRFLNVKPDLGLITSTARTFIQAGVTTEYATRVLGTTLDNGRLYAHLLTKSSRVLYDDSPSKSPEHYNKKWNVNENDLVGEQFIRNIDYVSPGDAVIAPTRLLLPENFGGNTQYGGIASPQNAIDEEILKESPSNNYRLPFQENQKIRSGDSYQNNIKVFRIGSQVPDYTEENVINHKELNEKPLQNEFLPSKVRPWENLPTFTVRNEFSPSGLSFLGDFPELEEHTERAKLISPADRKAKLLFKAGLVKPSHRDLTSITYSGFADFTTTVGDTVIIFTPNTKEAEILPASTKPAEHPVSIQATTTLQAPPLATRVKTFLSQEPPMETKTFKGDKLEMKTLLPTMVIDKTDRTREAKSHSDDERLDMEAKSAVLAREQGQDSSIPFTAEVIEPSESQPSMLSTPSNEDIAKIFASLQASAKQATEPLSSFTSIPEPSVEPTKDTSLSGATTIFFDEDVPSKTSALESTPSSIPLVPEEESSEVTATTTEKEATEPLNVEEANSESLVDSTVCSGGSEVYPTTAYKTLTYLTTFFIPVEGSTTTSIKSNEVISTESGLATRPCQNIATTPEVTTSVVTVVTEEITTIQNTEPLLEAVTEPITEHLTENHTEQHDTTTQEFPETTMQDFTTDITDPTTEQVETTTSEDDEIEVIFKTLYTTYTYLTTYFQETTSSIASRIVVTTNVITSTLDPGHEATDTVEGLLGTEDQATSFKTKTVTFEDVVDTTPRDVGITPTISLPSADEPEEPDSQEHVLSKPTPMLDDNSLLQTMNAVKTYYTTYTYFTTIFVDGETEISSRTEVYTNFVTPSMRQDVMATEAVNLDEDDSDEESDEDDKPANQVQVSEFSSKLESSYNTINRQSYSTRTYQLDNDITGPEMEYSTIERDNTNKLNNEVTENSDFNFSDYETIATMVTDVRSSTSEGDRRIIDNVDKRNILLDDQVVSESNNDSEIIPSPTLLLQTSYTTFTYFTTMYQGTTSSNVVSRLETITNVVTQTLTPTQTLSIDDLNLPITYFTTFTYWTTLYKDGTTKITSREETLSNIETPTVATPPEMVYTSISSTPVSNEIIPTTSETIVPSSVGEDDLTTYFTTYTYYTTSYVGDSSVLNSRLETVTNVLNNSQAANGDHTGRAIGSAHGNKIEDDTDKSKTEAPTTTDIIRPTGLLSTIESTVENDGLTTVLSTDIYGTYVDGRYAQVLESTSSILTKNVSASPVVVSLQPTGVVSVNKGKIVDAEGVSTLFYTTQAVGTYIDNLYAQVIESTSSLSVDEVKKAGLPTDLPIAYRTGLVRLIEGSIVENDSTTFYESKVLGTMIDGRYAQIIESTSSFLVGKASITPSAVSETIPSATVAPEGAISTTGAISPSPVVIEGSISETSKAEEDASAEESDEDEDKDNGSTKSRLSFQSRKRTFTPAIRPFASRQRPTFAPKRKAFGQSTAATITRSDFTPTVTAVLASKTNRFGGRRSSSAINVQPTASGSRRFSRPKSSSLPGYSSSFGGGRRSSSSRIQATIPGSSSRRAGFRSSSLFGSRPRIRPTLATGLVRSPSSNVVTQIPPDEENDLTTLVTDEPTNASGGDFETTLELQTTTEGSRRNQNPLLKFRRPLARTPGTRNTPAQSGRATTPRRPSSTTTSRPKPTYNRPSSLLSRSRPNALFPRRNLFTTTTPAPEEEPEDSDDLEEEEESDDDIDYDSSLVVEKVVDPDEGRQIPKVNIPRPFFRKRSRRDTYSRFRRPSSTTTTTAASVSEEEIEHPVRGAGRNRYVPKGRNAKSTTTTNSPRAKITPSKTTPRTQFTLREKDKKTNFKRPTTASRSRPTTSNSRLNSRSRNNQQTEPSYRKPTTTSRQNSRSRARTTQRQRHQKNDIPEHDNFVLPPSDGTITVTHQIPTEITIPVVNGKITEYKNVVTAKFSTEVLGPRQYSTTVNPFGKEQKVLLSENTGINNNGATLITQFVLNETPTTSVIFTPTYINRRKTSFSHIVPSTIYGVEQIVNTIQPALVAQAPLANILLSQLLLGGLQPQQNPLLGLQQPQVATPTTEIKTRTTTYVTTVTSETSTVIPLTFRGKEILTTIIDSSVTVLTATEFLTDTVVVTPTFGFQAPQLNTALLLQLQQLQQQQQSLPVPQLLPQANAFTSEALPEAQPLLNEEEKFNFALEESEDTKDVEEVVPKPKAKGSRRGKKNKVARVVEPSKETSVITLYVSGRTPGEFTTVLSTITVEEGGRSKRDIHDIPVKPSRIRENSEATTAEAIDSLVMPTKEIDPGLAETNRETESLESIIGNVPKHMSTKTPELFGTKPSKYKKAFENNQTKFILAKTGDNFFG